MIESPGSHGYHKGETKKKENMCDDYDVLHLQE